MTIYGGNVSWQQARLRWIKRFYGHDGVDGVAEGGVDGGGKVFDPIPTPFKAVMAEEATQTWTPIRVPRVRIRLRQIS